MTTEDANIVGETISEKLSTEEIINLAKALGVRLEDDQLTDEKKRETAQLLAILYTLVYKK